MVQAQSLEICRRGSRTTKGIVEDGLEEFESGTTVDVEELVDPPMVTAGAASSCSGGALAC